MEIINKEVIIQAYDDIRNLLKYYNEYKFKFVKTDDDVIYGEDENVEAFSILLVMTGARDAMLLQTFEDQSEQYTTKEGWNEILEVMRDRCNKLKILIQQTHIINPCELLFDDGEVWIYNTSIQKEVDDKFETNNIYDILRYGCKYPKLEENCVMYIFKYDGMHLFGIRSEKIDLNHIRNLLNQLERFKSVANILGNDVVLEIRNSHPII